MRNLHNMNAKAVLIFVVVVMGFSLAYKDTVFATTSSSSASAPYYISQYGSAGSGNGQFNDPYGIAINQSTGDTYTIDSDNSRVQEFTSSGIYITQWGSAGSGNGQFNFASGIAINQSTGSVYVADSDNSRVQEFTSSGTYITQWGSAGSGNGQFSEDYFLAINQSTGNVYVVDSNNFRVQEFTSSGTYITQWGSAGSGNGQFSWPFGIAINDSTGDVYVADGNNSNIQEFTNDGTYIGQFGSYGTGDGQFNGAYGIALNQLTDDIYVTDVGNNRVEKFRLSQNLAQETAPGTDNLVNLTLPDGSNITDESIASATSAKDSNYTFPLGLLSFTFQTANGVSGVNVPIQITFQTNLIPSEVTPLIYNSNTQAYTKIPGATVAETTVDGKPALSLSYSIMDGGPLDQDSTANGVIFDPVGLATLPTINLTNATAPDTGYGSPSNSHNLVSYGLLTAGLLAILIGVRRFTTNRSCK